MQPGEAGAVVDGLGAGRVVDGVGAGVVVVVGRGVAVGDGVGAAVGDVLTDGLGFAPDPNSVTQSSNHARARCDRPATPAACRSTHHWPSWSGARAGTASSTGATSSVRGPGWKATNAPATRTGASSKAAIPA